MKLHIYICICLFFLISIYNQGPTETQSPFRRSTPYDEDNSEFSIYSQSTHYAPSKSSKPSIHHLSIPNIVMQNNQSSQPAQPASLTIPATPPAFYANTTEQEDNMNYIHTDSKEEEGEEEKEDDQEDLSNDSSILHSVSIVNSTLFPSCNSSRKPYVYHCVF